MQHSRACDFVLCQRNHRAQANHPSDYPQENPTYEIKGVEK
jgi:hypothetical protein